MPVCIQNTPNPVPNETGTLQVDKAQLPQFNAWHYVCEIDPMSFQTFKKEHIVELAHLIESLSRPEAYPFPVEDVTVLHTHISVVFLAGQFAYKVKKPVALGFLDFKTLERRRHFCEQEVHLNRRLAPTVYLGVVPVARTPSGPRFESEGDIVEWAVKMQRLPEEATLQNRLSLGEVTPTQVVALGKRVARFHAEAQAGNHISSFGRLEVVAQNVRENFEQAEPLIGVTISRIVFDRLRFLADLGLKSLGPLIDKRAQSNFTRDTHGDLHLDHVYVFPDRPPAENLLIIDCIEFTERFRYSDPVADMAFLYMDFLFHGRRDLAVDFANSYFHASGDEEGRVLLPFYAAYRTAVRAKVEGFELTEEEVPETERIQALARARAHWLLALGELEIPIHRPCLLLVGGLPGTGKSTLARGLSQMANFKVIRTDVIRKELAVHSGTISNNQTLTHDFYSKTWNQRTYAECLDRAEKLLFQGHRVLVDATFREEEKRKAFIELAARLAVAAVFIVCQADPEVVRSRISRRRGDASDADWSVYEKLTTEWQETEIPTRCVLRYLPLGNNEEETISAGLKVLREVSLIS
jgi:aminoglycoside phosphotransferase family enzyme/predicted kinase